MIQLIAAAAISWLALVGVSIAAPSAVQFKTSSGTGATAVATLTAGVTAGNFVFVCANGIGGGTTLAITDGSSNTYTDSGQGTVTTGDLATTQRCGAFFAPTAGVTVFTATWTGGNPAFSEIVAVEVTGLTAPASFDKVVLGKGTTGATMTAGPTATLSSSNEFVAGYLISNNGASGAGQPAGWTINVTANSNALEYDGVTTTTAVTATAGQTSGSFDAWVFTFKGTAVSVVCKRSLLGVGC